MPRGGSSPGERRGGRQSGSRNKVTVEREAKFQEMRDRLLSGVTPEQIAVMLPLDVMLQAMQLEAQAGDWRAAALLAKEAAPYIHAKPSPKPPPTDDETKERQSYIVAPDQSESVEEWTRESQRILSQEKSGDPNQDPKPSS
jgi:hypothetical protein